MKVTYKGYTAIQSDYNNHVMVFDHEGHAVCHASVMAKCSLLELKEHIDDYLKLLEKIKAKESKVEV